MAAVDIAPAQRRVPTQERSRRTVEKILDAAEVIIDEQGLAAATTRAIADRAGVAYPSLYRFFTDREEILEVLVERHTSQVDALAQEAEQQATLTSAIDLFDLELGTQIAYYRQHPSSARLWHDTRMSDRMRDIGQRRMDAMAQRMHRKLIDEGLLPASTRVDVVRMIVEIGDRVIDFARRGRDDFDADLLAEGRSALVAYIDAVARR